MGRPRTRDGFGIIRPAGLLDTDDEGIDVIVDTLQIVGDTLQSGIAARSCHDGALLWSRPEAVTVRRVSGPTRTGTAAAVSADLRQSADTVVIARSDRWPDAVTGAPLATLLDAALLLAEGDRLGADARAELLRLGADRAVLLGGEAALPTTVADELTALGVTVERIGGVDRFATAAAIARRVVAEGGDATRVAIARGIHPDPEQGWSDAVTASAFAAEAGNPVLLVGPDQLPASAEAVMAELGTTRSLIIGGTAAVSGPVEQAIRQTGVTTLRVGGFDRYSTARATAQLAMQEGVTPVTVWVATGRRFADALTASAATGTRGVLLLTAGDPTDTAEQVLSYVGVNRSAIDEIVLIGGTAAIDPAVETLLAAVLG